MTKEYGIPLTVTHPEIAIEADGWDPEKITRADKYPRAWKCKYGHKWTVTTINRTYRKRGCPYCSENKVIVGKNDFASKYPYLVKFADGWDPTSFKSGSNLELDWKCEYGHKWKSPINRITSSNPKNRSICPYCLNQRVWPGFNDLKTTHPDLAEEADGWDPSSVVAGSTNEKRRWKCKLGHTWEAVVHSRSKSSGTGCPYCANQKVWPGFNDLKTINPILAKQADGWDPTTVTIRSTRKKNWKCEKNHKWSAFVGNRGKGVGCPYCANQKVLSGFNDLHSQYPEIASELFGSDPKKIISKSNKKLEWKCPKGHIYKTTPGSRIKGDGCPICSGHQVLFGFNDLQTLDPQLAKEACGWDPRTVTYRSSKLRLWKCVNNHQWRQRVSVRGKGIGCPTCAKSGFDPNASAFLYFLEHQDWEMFQIGIANNIEERIGKHKRNGWQVIEIRGPMEGQLTHQWETAILRMLKAKGADLANSKIAGKFDGYSEAWSKGKFEAKSIRQLMDLTEEFENRENTKKSR